MYRTTRSDSENRFLNQERKQSILKPSVIKLSSNKEIRKKIYYSGQYFHDKNKSYNKDLSQVFNKFNKINLLPKEISLQNLNQDNYVTRILPISPSETIYIDSIKTSRDCSKRFIHRKYNSQISFTQKQKLKNAGSILNIDLKKRLILIVLNHNLTKQLSSQREAELLLHQVSKELLDHLKLGQIELYFYTIKGEPLKSLFDCHKHKTIIVSPTKQFNGISDEANVLVYLEQLESVLENTPKQLIQSESLEHFISKKYQNNIQNIANYLQQQNKKDQDIILDSKQIENLYQKCKKQTKSRFKSIQELQLSNNIVNQQLKYKNINDYINDDQQITISPKQLENEHIIRQYSTELEILQKAILQNHDPSAVEQHVVINGQLIKCSDPSHSQQHISNLQQLIGQKVQQKNTYEVQFGQSEKIKKNIFNQQHTKKHLLQNLQKRQKLLFTQNIPQLIEETKLNRKELYSTYNLYQTLEAVSSQMEEDYKIGDGVTFEAFRNGIYQVSMQPFDLAKSMFQQIDYNFSGSLNWREFLNLMVAIRAKTLMDRVNLFIKIADKDGNKALSYEEVNNLTKICLNKYMKENTQFLDKLCDYFTKLIFETLKINEKEDIPLEKIKQTILDGGENSELLSMFCGADL